MQYAELEKLSNFLDAEAISADVIDVLTDAITDALSELSDKERSVVLDVFDRVGDYLSDEEDFDFEDK